MLTTGFNAPICDLIALIRPTASTSLYLQMVGRGTRCIGADITESIANGKRDCLLLDFGGNIRRHGPLDKPNVTGGGLFDEAEEEVDEEQEEEEEEDEADPAVLAKKQKQLAKRGVTFEAKVDPKVTLEDVLHQHQ